MKKDEIIKLFNVRLPYNIWHFLKLDSIDKEISMNQIIINTLQKYMEKSGKRC